MSQLALYLDPTMAEQVDEAAKRAGMSRSAWVREAVARRLREREARLPEWWWNNLGTWEDERSVDEIVADIDAGLVETERAELE